MAAGIGGKTGIFLDELVQSRDIGRVMTIMMDRHCHRIDIRLERVETIAERRHLEHGFGGAGGRDEARPGTRRQRGGESQCQSQTVAS
jgi:hypothetical protein